MAYARDLSRRLQEASPAFDERKFRLLVEKDLKSWSLASVKNSWLKVSKIAFPYLMRTLLKVFEKILGPELEGGLGMFSEGYWLWPIGKYVELYGDKEFELSAAFSRN